MIGTGLALTHLKIGLPTLILVFSLGDPSVLLAFARVPL